MASSKNRSAIGWFFVCMLLPLIGLILLLVLNDPTKPSQVIVHVPAVERENSTTVEKPFAPDVEHLPAPDPQKHWASLLEYDPILRDAAKSLSAFGPRAVDEFRDAYMTLRDRSMVPHIVSRITERHAAVLQHPVQQGNFTQRFTDAPPSDGAGPAVNVGSQNPAPVQSQQMPELSAVNEQDVLGAQFLEAYRGYNLFQLRDGRIFIDRYAALASVANARRVIDQAIAVRSA